MQNLSDVFFPYSVGENGFDEGLVGDVTLVGHYLEIIDERDWEADGDGFGTGFECREIHFNSLELVGIICKTVSGPKTSLLVFVFEVGKVIFYLFHIDSFLFCLDL